MEREKAQKLKIIVKAAALGGTAVTLAALSRVGERYDKTPSDEVVDVKAFQSGKEQIDQAREIYDQVIFQNDKRKTSRWEDAVKRLAGMAPTPESTINIVGECQASGVAPAPGVQVESSVNLAGEAALEKYKSELPRVLEIAQAHPENFPDLEALQMYYPIYRASGERFGIPWELLYIMHGQESGFSTGTAAFVVTSDQYGCMQRNIYYHPQQDVDRYFASDNMDYLLTLPVRHFDDAEEIFYAAAVMKEYTDQEGSIQEALFRYSAAGPAKSRWEKLQAMLSLVGP